LCWHVVTYLCWHVVTYLCWHVVTYLCWHVVTDLCWHVVTYLCWHVVTYLCWHVVTHLKSASWKAVTVLNRPRMVLTVLLSRSGKYRMVSELKLTLACGNYKATQVAVNIAIHSCIVLHCIALYCIVLYIIKEFNWVQSQHTMLVKLCLNTVPFAFCYCLPSQELFQCHQYTTVCLLTSPGHWRTLMVRT